MTDFAAQPTRVIQLSLDREQSMVVVWALAVIFGQCTEDDAYQVRAALQANFALRKCGTERTMQLINTLNSLMAAAFPEIEAREFIPGDTCSHCSCDPGDTCCFCSQTIPNPSSLN